MSLTGGISEVKEKVNRASRRLYPFISECRAAKNRYDLEPNHSLP
jgi:hypothetical protein